MWEKLLYFDRRIIFLLIGAAVLIPFLIQWTLPHGKITDTTQDLFDAIEQLPAGTPVMISFDYGPSSMPEVEPMATALAYHILSRDLRLVAATLFITGPPMADRAIVPVAKELGKQYGTDWVNLGYKPGGAFLLTQMGENIKQAHPTDARGNSTADLPVMAGVGNYDDIGLVVDLASGAAPTAWIVYAHDPYQVKVAAGVTAVEAVDYYKFLQTGQLIGLLNGLKGAAEYEFLVGREGFGKLGMASQSVAHLLIILLVIIGNIGYFTIGRYRRQQR